MSFLDRVYLGNSLKSWVIAVGLAVVLYLAIRLAERVLRSRLKSIAERTRSDLDDMAAELVRSTKFFFALVIGLYAGARLLTLPGLVWSVIRGAAVVGVLVQAAIWTNGFLSFLLNRYVQRRMEDDASLATSLGALRFLSKLIVWSAVLLLALDNLGYNVKTLLAGLGIGGVAVALALQSILGDLFASLAIVLDKPFVIGDFIIVGDLMGTVEYIGLKTTRLRSLSGEQLVFSNSDLLKSRIRNFKRMYERRVLFSLGVTYDTPLEKLEAISGMLKEIVEAQENTRFDRAHFKQYGDFSLIYEIVYYVLKPDYNLYMDIQQAINLEIYRRFTDQGIEFAFPTQTLYLHRQEAGEAT